MQNISITSIRNHLASKLFKRKFIAGIDHWCSHPQGRALIYYKTDSLTPGHKGSYSHTNLWEARCLVRVLNQLGYIVDIVDRTIDDSFVPKDIYNIFLGIGVDDSGRNYTRYAQATPNALHLLYATSLNPLVRQQNLMQRYENFYQRNNLHLPVTRSVTQVNIQEVMNNCDYLLVIGNDHTIATYSKYKKPTFRIMPPTAPGLRIDNRAITEKKTTHILFFSGTGNILKGLDLAIEAAAQTDIDLHICSILEPEFADFYRPVFEESPNIHVYGFVDITSKTFRDLTSICSYVLLPSCAEGTATSITTCMRRGLIPIVTKESGIDTGSFGWSIEDISIPGLKAQLIEAAQTDIRKARQKMFAAYQESFNYTQSSYEKSLTGALLQILEQEDWPNG